MRHHGANPHRLRLATALTVLLSSIEPAGAQRSAPKSQAWKVKDTSERLRIEGDYLLCTSPEGIVTSVPLSKVTGLVLETRSARPVVETMKRAPREVWEHALESGDARVAFVALEFIVASETAMASVSWVKTHRYYVHVIWREAGYEHSVAFRLAKPDALKLLGGLREATGRNWVDLDLGRKGPQANAQVLNIRMPGYVAVDTIEFSPGTYPMVFAEGEDGFGVVYFYGSESLEFDRVVATAVVSVTPLTDEQAPHGVIARDETGRLRLTEIRLRHKLLKLSSPAEAMPDAPPPAKQP